ncbi:hypothetical protein C0993_010120 [Termitomyces sp. T159_Od127]|nr:hypothetical protein C0993_010120 [Termitomyces sp. T159_Od127]
MPRDHDPRRLAPAPNERVLPLSQPPSSTAHRLLVRIQRFAGHNLLARPSIGIRVPRPLLHARRGRPCARLGAAKPPSRKPPTHAKQRKTQRKEPK